MAFIEWEKGQEIDEAVKILDYQDGGLGRVYFAFCRNRQIKVVIKTIRRALWEEHCLSRCWPQVKDDLIHGRLPFRSIDAGEYLYFTFFREARLICQARYHPNVLRGNRFWWSAEGQPFFECEFVEKGQGLDTLLEKESAASAAAGLAVLELAHIALSFCNGMIYITREMLANYNSLQQNSQAVGFVHRDIKPENILIDPQNQIKIIDMGIAKFIVVPTPTELVRFPMQCGTPIFMAPEQSYNFEQVTTASDIYSLGATLYKLAGGKSADLPRLVNKGKIVYPAYLPQEFCALLDLCLKEKWAERYQDFQELKTGLSQFLVEVRAGRVLLRENQRCRACGYVSPALGPRPEGESDADQEFVPVPAGPFLKGCREEDARQLSARLGQHPYKDERFGQVTLPAYAIALYPVTNTQYLRFVRETRYQPVPSHWQDPFTQSEPFPAQLAEHPVVNVSFADAVAYCRWAGCRLPTGDEWEKAARGEDGRLYPWGNTYNSAYCNSAEARRQGTAPVRAYPEGRSPYGCYQMVGNVFEWVNEPHPQRSSYKYVRGGSWAVTCEFLGLPFFHYLAAPEQSTRFGGQSDIVGFRCARDISGRPQRPARVSGKESSQFDALEDATVGAKKPIGEESQPCPLCGGKFIPFRLDEIKAPEKNIYTWRGFFDIE